MEYPRHVSIQPSQWDKVYIGDAVYADFDRFGDLVLTTEDGLVAYNRIVLDGNAIEALERYLERRRQWCKGQQS